MNNPYPREPDHDQEPPRAACVGMWHFYESDDLEDRRSAMRLCSTCEVAGCEFRLTSKPVPRTSTFDNCGTSSAAEKHRTRGETLCDPCRIARNERDRQQRAKRKAARDAA